MHDGFSHEQTPVAGEQDAFLALEDLSQFLILVVVPVETVKAEHPQVDSQPPEVIVEQEARLERASIWDRMDLDLVSILGDRRERSLLTIDLHVSNLRMRHPQRLHQMLDGLPPAKLYAD